MTRECPICSAGSDLFLAQMFDDRFGCPTVCEVFRCQGCGHCFLNPELERSEIKDLYENYYGRRSDFRLPGTSFKRKRFRNYWLGNRASGQLFTSPSNSQKILDVGSGECIDLWQATELGFNAFGFDVDSTTAEIANANGLKVRTGADISTAYVGEEFDWIQLNQVIEHFVDPDYEIDLLKQHLASDGSIFLSTPNSGSIFRRICGRRWINWHVPYHQHHFTRKSIRKLCERNDLEVQRVITVTPFGWSRLQIQRQLCQVNQGLPSAMWNGRMKRPRGSDTLETLLLTLLIVPVRIIDFFGWGDCLVVIAKASRLQNRNTISELDQGLDS